ncbi:hypothetical protein KIL84_018334 [Mauremys mutica]|uniref:Uncharacterized protein n=1 Tax=Mauremys mutica TaxID=74926 RepID=A0A9D3XUK9_9SAUR|nr:hypothetical protein KIL84_018334 [Mauremys mutica]
MGSQPQTQSNDSFVMFSNPSAGREEAASVSDLSKLSSSSSPHYSSSLFPQSFPNVQNHPYLNGTSSVALQSNHCKGLVWWHGTFNAHSLSLHKVSRDRHACSH